MIAKASGDKKAKSEILKQIIEKDPTNVDANVELANDQMVRKNFKLANTYYGKSLEKEPNNEQALFGYGQSAYYNDDLKKARTSFEKLIEVNPENSFGWAYLGKLEGDDENYAVATRHIEKALELDPYYYDYWVDYGRYLYYQGKFADAEKAWTKAISIEPDNFSDKFLSLFENDKLAPHMHICLQSGAENTLKAIEGVDKECYSLADLLASLFDKFDREIVIIASRIYDVIDMNLLFRLVSLAENGIRTIAHKFVHLLLDSDTRHLGFKTSLLATSANLLVIEEWDMSELASKAILTIVELAIDDDADGHATTHMQVEDIALVLRLARSVLSIAACAGVVLEHHAYAYACRDDIGERLLARGEVLIRAARLGVHATNDRNAHAKNLLAVYARCGNEVLDILTYALKALGTVDKLEAVVGMLEDDVVLQVGNDICHMVARHVDAREVDCRVSQAENIGAAATRRFNLAEVDDDAVVDKLLNKLGHRGHADVQLARELRERRLTIDGHIGDDVSLDDVVLVRDALEVSIGIYVEILR